MASVISVTGCNESFLEETEKLLRGILKPQGGHSLFIPYSTSSMIFFFKVFLKNVDFLKVFIEFVTVLLLFYVLVFWFLAPQTGFKPAFPQNRNHLTTREVPMIS